MAYNLESLVKVIELILNSPYQHELILDHKIFIPQIESLLEKSCFLRDSLATILSQEDRMLLASTLEDQIRDVAQNAEDVLETYHVPLSSSDKGSTIPSLATLSEDRTHDLQKLFEDFDSLKEEMMKILEGSQTSDCVSSSLPAVSSSRGTTDPNPKKILVGFAGNLDELMERIFGDSPKLEIIPIVGMGGIGKTTLARNIYDDSSVLSHFDARAWTTVSYDYSLEDILLDLLSCITGKHRDELIQEIDSNQLGISLHKNLMGRRYLIVLDDIWRSKAWDDVKMFFPSQNNGSRIILTTRESNVATYADSKSPHHQVRPLDGVDSWKLLRVKVFGDQETTCSPELEEIGTKIANNCGGLPLAIHVIGGLLSHTDGTKDSWEQVAGDVSSAIANKDEQYFSGILSLSYDHLPYYLKPCFHYMSAFPEDHEIRASKLIRLWVAEGFLEPIEDKSPEEAAEMYLEALIDRNLIFASRREKSRGKVKSVVMHDLLRDLCVTMARKNRFFHGMSNNNNIPQGNMFRRVSIHTPHYNTDIYSLSIGQMSFARSLLFTGSSSEWIFSSPTFSSLSLLRVLDVLTLRFFRFPRDILKLVNLRYLAFTYNVDHELDPRITSFRNLHTLIFQVIGFTKVTPEIFNMPCLRVIKFIGSQVWCDCNVKKSKKIVPQVNLHTLCGLQITNFDMVVEKIPNLKKLAIHYNNRVLSDSMVTDLACLRKLETLKCTSYVTRKSETYSLNFSSFPPSLKKLSLRNSKITEACMKTIGMLPNLEILKLARVFLERSTWKPCEGEFCRLQYLVLERLDLVDWVADETNFPVLQHLDIRSCYHHLMKIPSGIGEISTLKTIEVSSSSPSIVASARKIQEEQLELGNDILQLHIS